MAYTPNLPKNKRYESREAIRMCEKRPAGGYPYIKDGHPENESVVIQYLSSEAIFYSIEDVMELTGWSKRVVQNLFNKRGFPSTNLGKRKLVESHALIAYFSEKRLREDEFCWE